IFTIAEPIFESGLSANLLGNFLLLSSAITFIIFEILSKKISTEYSIKTRTIYFYLIGSLSFLPFFVSDVSEKGLYFLNFKPIIGITFIVILASLTAIPLWQWGI